MAVKFRWVPNNEEGERKWIDEMAKYSQDKPFDLTDTAVDDIQKKLLEMSANGNKLSNHLANNLIPVLANMRIKLFFSKPMRIEKEGKLICYVCKLNVTPGAWEGAIKETANRMGMGKFMGIMGFNYGKVEFFQ